MTRRTRGFTLIELLVVVTVITIMLAIAVPSFTSFISNYRATSAINDVLQGITLARGEALKRGRRVVMLPNGGDAARTPSPTGSWSNGWTVFVDLNNNQTLDSTDTMIYKHPDLPSSVAAAPVGSATTPFGGANYVSFDGTGYPRKVDGSQLGGGIALTDHTGASTNLRTLCLATLGRPRIVKDTPAETCEAG